jgi:hypothetical protein
MLDKLHNILQGWKNYAFESKEIESMAKARAVDCAGCDMAVYGLVASLVNDEIKEIKGLVCNGCETNIKCPLSGKLRSPNESCPKGLWQARIK